MGTIMLNGNAYSGGSSNKFNENEFVIEDNVVSLKDVDADSLGGRSADSILRDIEKLKEINPIKVKGKVGSFEELPSGAEIGDLYFVSRDGEEDSDEYVWTEDGWEKVGNMDIDLSGYVTEDELKDKYRVKETAISTVQATTATIDVPEKAMTVGVSKLYGKTVKVDDELYSAPVERVVSVGKNILDLSNLKYQYMVTHGEGEVVAVASNINVYLTDYIPVKAGEKYFFTGMTILNSGNTGAMFDANKNYAGPITTDADARPLTIPSGVVYIRLNLWADKYTNKNYRNAQLLHSATDDTTYYPFNKTTVLVPQEIKNLPDYGCSIGDIKNEVDFENGVYYHRVGSANLGTFDYSSDTAGPSGKRFGATSAFSNIKIVTIDKTPNIICSHFHNIVPVGSTSDVDGKIGTTLDGSGRFVTSDVELYKNMTTEQFKTAMNGVMLYYELATPEMINISSYINPLPVEPGGTITLENAHNLDMDNTIKYKMEV